MHNLKRFIAQHYNFRDEDMVVLTDDQKDPTRRPTRANIVAAMRWLVHEARPNDSFFLHYSGHGTYVADKDGDEDDGYDEAICPVDFKSAGNLVDDEIHAICVAPLPPGVRLTCIFDSCHSGSAMDLPYMYSTSGELKTNTALKQSGKKILGSVPQLMMGNKVSALMSIGSTLMGVAKGRGAEERTKATRTSPADVIMFSGCKDSQTSADANISGGATGAMSFAFRTALEKNKQQSYQQLLVSVREILKAKYSQLPQLSSSHPMDMRLLFIM